TAPVGAADLGELRGAGRHRGTDLDGRRDRPDRLGAAGQHQPAHELPGHGRRVPRRRAQRRGDPPPGRLEARHDRAGGGLVIALAYLATVAVSLVVLAVALRRRPAPAPAPLPPAPGPDRLPVNAEAEVRLILAAAAQLAAKLTPAA